VNETVKCPLCHDPRVPVVMSFDTGTEKTVPTLGEHRIYAHGEMVSIDCPAIGAQIYTPADKP